jgi:hypothetical protein
MKAPATGTRTASIKIGTALTYGIYKTLDMTGSIATMAALVAAGRDTPGNAFAFAFSPSLFGLRLFVAIILLLAVALVSGGRMH